MENLEIKKPCGCGQPRKPTIEPTRLEYFLNRVWNSGAFDAIILPYWLGLVSGFLIAMAIKSRFF